jgi:hypothetical protein
MNRLRLLLTILITTFAASAAAGEICADRAEKMAFSAFEIVSVSGTGTHYFTTSIVHSTEPTETGMIQRSTDTVDGDLIGRVLYHPVSVFDFTTGTLVNTGDQVFSGTVLGHGPVLLHDDEFRFEIDLATGATVGEAHFDNRLAGPNIRCDLEIVGTGLDAEGNATVAYTGSCRIKKVGNDGVDGLPR